MPGAVNPGLVANSGSLLLTDPEQVTAFLGLILFHVKGVVVGLISL